MSEISYFCLEKKFQSEGSISYPLHLHKICNNCTWIKKVPHPPLPPTPKCPMIPASQYKYCSNIEPILVVFNPSNFWFLWSIDFDLSLIYTDIPNQFLLINLDICYPWKSFHFLKGFHFPWVGYWQIWQYSIMLINIGFWNSNAYLKSIVVNDFAVLKASPNMVYAWDLLNKYKCNRPY